MVLSPSVQLLMKTWRVLKFMGLSSVTIDGRKSVTKPLDVFCFLVNVLLGALICYFAVTRRMQIQSSSSSIAFYGNFITFVASIWIAVISMVCVFIHRHRIFSIVLALSDIDTMVSTASVEISILMLNYSSCTVLSDWFSRQLHQSRQTENVVRLFCHFTDHPDELHRVLLGSNSHQSSAVDVFEFLFLPLHRYRIWLHRCNHHQDKVAQWDFRGQTSSG